MAPGSDPYATPLQKRVDALLCIFIVVVIALVLRTSAHGQTSNIRSEWDNDEWSAERVEVSLPRFNFLLAPSTIAIGNVSADMVLDLQQGQTTRRNTSDDVLFAPSALTASATWSTTPTNGNWVAGPTETNWSGGAGTFPGSTSGTTNGDTATFLTSNTTAININSATLNVKSIIFGSSTTVPSNFVIGTTSGNSLALSSGGEIAVVGLPSGTTNVTETVNAPLVLEPASSTAAGTYGFRNSASGVTNTLTIGGAVTGGTTSAGITLDLNGTNTGPNLVSGVISNGGATGGLAITKSNGGTWKLTGNNTYTGTTTINSGTLTVAGTSGNQVLGGTSGVTVNSAGTLLQTSSNQINNTAGMTLNGGIYRLNGVSEGTTAAGGAGLGALTLSSSSIIDLSGTNPSLHFAASNGQPWSGTLSIWNWNGTVTTGNGVEQIAFGSNNLGLTAAQLNQISFFSGSGIGFLGTAGFAPDFDGEIIPVPEPSTWIVGALALVAAGLTQRRHLKRLVRHSAQV